MSAFLRAPPLAGLLQAVAAAVWIGTSGYVFSPLAPGRVLPAGLVRVER